MLWPLHAEQIVLTFFMCYFKISVLQDFYKTGTWQQLYVDLQCKLYLNLHKSHYKCWLMCQFQVYGTRSHYVIAVWCKSRSLVFRNNRLSVSYGKSTIPSSHATRIEEFLREKCKSCSKVSFCVISGFSARVHAYICTHIKQRETYNYFYIHRIPVGTSQELQSLLIGLLRRNAKERMPFDVFFNHPFLQRNVPNIQQSVAPDLPSPFASSQKSNVIVAPAINNVPKASSNNNINNNVNNNVKNGEFIFVLLWNCEIMTESLMDEIYFCFGCDNRNR